MVPGKKQFKFQNIMCPGYRIVGRSRGDEEYILGWKDQETIE